MPYTTEGQNVPLENSYHKGKEKVSQEPDLATVREHGRPGNCVLVRTELILLPFC